MATPKTTTSSLAGSKQRILASALPLVLATLSFAGAHQQERDLSEFESIKQPKLSTKKSQKMLMVEATGDPNVVGPRAFGLLFQLYFRWPESRKNPMPGAPRARWPSIESPRSEWLGRYGLPVPETLTAVPEHSPQEGLKVSLTTWEYGEVVEILHLGPYDREEPTMQKAKDFIRENKYAILDGHEEEYIRGPGMNSRGDPEKYVTVLRYRVKKIEK
jgi:hypothetical protein